MVLYIEFCDEVIYKDENDCNKKDVTLSINEEDFILDNHHALYNAGWEVCGISYKISHGCFIWLNS